MTTFITINGNRYVAKEFDFNMICDLQDMGIDISSSVKMPLIRAYVASCMEVDKAEAGKELEKHIISFGDASKALAPIVEVIGKKVEESDFFHALSQTEEEEVAEKKAPRKK